MDKTKRYGGKWRDPIDDFVRSRKTEFRCGDVYEACIKVRGSVHETSVRTYLQTLVKRGIIERIRTGVYGVVRK